MDQEKPGKKAANKKAKQKRSDSLGAGSVPSLQSMESLLSGFGAMARKKPSAVDEAQDIMYDAWEATTRKQRVALAKKAIEISADCADAYVLLAAETARSLEEAIDLYRKGVEAGERALGKKLFKEEVGYFWGLLETRPYMRARLGLAQCMWEAGTREAAIEHYWDMLRLNPNDNQGIRDLLVACLLELGRDKDAENLFRQYKEDGMAVWMYSRTLLDFRKHGPSPIADKSLKAAVNENKHVPAYLLGRKKMPPNLPGYYGFGDENEAALFAHGNETAWKATPGALEWLAAKAK